MGLLRRVKVDWRNAPVRMRLARAVVAPRASKGDKHHVAELEAVHAVKVDVEARTPRDQLLPHSCDVHGVGEVEDAVAVEVSIALSVRASGVGARGIPSSQRIVDARSSIRLFEPTPCLLQLCVGALEVLRAIRPAKRARAVETLVTVVRVAAWLRAHTDVLLAGDVREAAVVGLLHLLVDARGAGERVRPASHHPAVAHKEILVKGRVGKQPPPAVVGAGVVLKARLAHLIHVPHDGAVRRVGLLHQEHAFRAQLLDGRVGDVTGAILVLDGLPEERRARQPIDGALATNPLVEVGDGTRHQGRVGLRRRQRLEDVVAVIEPRVGHDGGKRRIHHVEQLPDVARELQVGVKVHPAVVV